MKTLPRLACLATAAALAGGLFGVGAPLASAEEDQEPLIGAVRWDGWFPGNPWVADSVFTDFPHRQPTYGWFDDQTQTNHQSIVDSQINAAADSDLDYWAFDWYPDVEFDDAYRYRGPYLDYKTSEYKERLKFANIVQTWWLGGPVQSQFESDWVPELVSDFLDPQYVRVDDRPVLYWFGTDELSNGSQGWGSVSTAQAKIQYLRDESILAGAGDPFIIQITGAVSNVATYGFDGLGSYANTALPSTGHNCWSQLAQQDYAAFHNYLSVSVPVVPTLTPMWDPRPRIQEPGYPLTYQNSWADQPTFGQWVDHVSGAIGWVEQNSAETTDPGLILIYGWNEFDEGGPGIAPSIGEGTKYLDGIEAAVAGAKPTTFDDKVNDDNCAVVLSSSGWVTASAVAGAYNSDQSNTSATGASATYTWPRTVGFDVLATTAPGLGTATVEVDGVSVGTIDFSSTSTQHQQAVFSSGALACGGHTVKITRLTGTVNVDAFVSHTRATCNAETSADINNSVTGSGAGQFQYVGSWASENSPSVGAFNDDDHYSNTTGDYALFRFTGTQIKFYGLTDPYHGSVGFSICDSAGANCGAETAVSAYSATRLGDQLLWTSPTLTSGSWSLKVRVTGVDGPNAHHYVSVDRVTVM